MNQSYLRMMMRVRHLDHPYSRYRIGGVILYCTTVFCLCVIHSSPSSSPVSHIASLRGGGGGSLIHHQVDAMVVSQVIWWSTLCCNPPIIWPIQEFRTHVSEPKRRTACNTALDKVLGIRASSPSFTRILDIRSHFFSTFRRLPTTSSHSFSKSIKIPPR